MNIQRLSAVLLIASFIVPAAFFFVNVPGYYQTQDIAERVRLVDEYRNLWNAGRILMDKSNKVRTKFSKFNKLHSA